MMLHIPGVLTPEEVDEFRARLEETQWTDGRETVGDQGTRVKRNRQVPVDSPIGGMLGREIVARLKHHALFFSAVLPLRFVPPLFNKYEGGEHYGLHVDGSVRSDGEMGAPLRTDL